MNHIKVNNFKSNIYLLKKYFFYKFHKPGHLFDQCPSSPHLKHLFPKLLLRAFIFCFHWKRLYCGPVMPFPFLLYVFTFMFSFTKFPTETGAELLFALKFIEMLARAVVPDVGNTLYFYHELGQRSRSTKNTISFSSQGICMQSLNALPFILCLRG